MKDYLVMLLTLSVMFLASACDGDDLDTNDADTVAGEMTSGEMTSGEMTSGEMTSGEMTSGEMTSGEMTSGEMTSGTGSWGDECSGNADCSADSPLCVINPMMGPPGYCSKSCTSTTQCADTLEGWTCNIIGDCASPTISWCGPNEEIAQAGGVLIECP